MSHHIGSRRREESGEEKVHPWEEMEGPGKVRLRGSLAAHGAAGKPGGRQLSSPRGAVWLSEMEPLWMGVWLKTSGADLHTRRSQLWVLFACFI